MAARDPRGPATLPDHAYWNRAAPEVLAAFASRPQGLSSAEAAERLARFGPNAVEESRDVAAFRLLLRQFASPLVLILVFGAVVSLFVRDWIDAAMILAIVLGSAFLGFTQEYRASAAVAALRKRLALRCGCCATARRERSSPAAIVPGDVIELAAGNLVPADGVILAARDFLVSEASLTGESMPVEKQPGVVRRGRPLAARTNCAFIGTSVRSGTATRARRDDRPRHGVRRRWRRAWRRRRRRPSSRAGCGSSGTCSCGSCW